MRKIIGTCLFLLIVTSISAQQPAMHESLAQYKTALELYDKEKYGAAQEQFGLFIRKCANSSYKREGNDLVAEAQFYQALCAFNLLHSNTKAMFEAFMAAHPTHARIDEALFHIGKMHYMRKEYEEAVPPLKKLDPSKLSKEQVVEARFYLGVGYYKQEKYREALSKFREIRNSEGKYGEMGAYYFALISYQKGDYKEAFNALDRIKEDNEFAKNVDLLKASCLLKMKRYDELDAMGKQLTSAKKVSNETLFILGNAAYDRNKFGDCITWFEKYEGKRGRMNREALYRMGYSYYKTGNYAKAMAKLDNCLKPEDAVAQNAYYYLGHSFLRIEKYANARTAFKKAAELDFDRELSGEALYQYAKASFETRFFEDALSGLQTFLEEYPESEYIPEAKGLIGEILLYTSNYKDAIEYLEKAGLRNPRAQTAYQRACYLYALSLYEKNKYDEAAEYFKTAYNQRRDSKITLSAYFWHAESVFRTNAHGEAVRAYKAYMNQPYASKDENYPQAWYGIGWSELKQKRYDRAGKAFEKYIGLADRRNNRELYVDAMLRAGDCEFALKNFNGALRYYKQVRDFNGMNVDYALFQMGLVYFRLKKYKKAAESHVRLATNHRKSAYRDDALITAAETYLTWLDDWQSCARYCRILHKEHPSSPFVPGALTRLAISEAKSNNRNAAIKYFKLVAYDHCYDAPSLTTALRGLSDLLRPAEYDKVESQSRKNCPDTKQGGDSGEREELAISIADQRYFDENYASAKDRFQAYIYDFPQGRYLFHARYYHGQCLEKEGDDETALTDYEFIYNASRANDYTVKALKAAADIHYKLGQNMAAMELYRAMEEKSDRMEDRLGAQFGKAKIHLANQDYAAAKADLLSVYNDQNTTDYSRTKAEVQIAVCDYFLGDVDEAFKTFSDIEKEHNNVFGAESQYYITRILYDRGDYEQSRIAALYMNDAYGGYNYWKAKAFLVLAENYIALGDTFQAMEGTLESLAKQDAYPDIQEAAIDRLKELEASKKEDNFRETPEDEDDDAGSMIEEENQ